MNSFERIVTYFGGDTSDFDAKIRKMSENVKDKSKEMASSFLTPWKGIATALAGYFTYSGLQEFGQKMKEAKHEAEMLGASSEFIEGLSRSVKKLGADPEQVIKSLGRFVTKMGDARAGSEDTAKSFKKWGISLYDATGNALTTEQILPKVAEKMKEMEDPSLRAAMAMDLFGKTGIQLVPILSQGAAAVEAWRDKARMTEADRDAVIEMANSFKVLGSMAESAAAKMMHALSAFRLLSGTKFKEETPDFDQKQFDEFRSNYITGMSTMARFALGSLGAGGAMILEARIRDAYLQSKRNLAEVDNPDTGREMAATDLETHRAGRALKLADEADKLDILREKYKTLSDEYEAFEEKDSEGAIKALDAMEAMQESIDEITQKAKKKSDDAAEAAKREVSDLQRIAQLKDKIKEAETRLTITTLNEVTRADIQTELSKDRLELAQKELTIAEKRKTAEEALRKSSEAFTRAQRERYGLTLGELAGEGIDFDAANGVRGSRRRKLARRNFRNFLNDVSLDEREARGTAQEIQGLEERAKMLAEFGHFGDAKSLRMSADDLRRTLPDWAKESEQDPMKQARDEMKRTADALDTLISDGGGTLPVTITNAAD